MSQLGHPLLETMMQSQTRGKRLQMEMYSLQLSNRNLERLIQRETVNGQTGIMITLNNCFVHSCNRALGQSLIIHS